jgi:L-threonylcarbamoyladenylate synthase
MEAAEIIRRGGLVAFPTETVYGLGANALDAAAVGRIYEAKGRPASSPLIVHVADRDMARSIAAEWPPLADKLADRFWPGPLTLIVRKSPAVPDIVTAGLDSVGIRMPAHPVALELIRRAGVPIAAPSANRFMQISPTTAEHVKTGLGDRVDVILDGGATTIGIESTVVSLVRRPPAVLRLGMISVAQLQDATGVRFEAPATHQPSSESPGLHPRHYAPQTPFYLLHTGQAHPPGRGKILALPSDPAQCAAMLYSVLHAADREGWEWLGIEGLPEGAEWAAIRDRLQRAATML